MNYHAMKRVLYPHHVEHIRDPYFDSHEHRIHVQLLNFEHHPDFEHRKGVAKLLALASRDKA